MNRYGATVMRHWARFLPQVYAGIRDPGFFFAIVGEQIAWQVDELAGQLAGDDRPGEVYLAEVRRLTAARCQAEEIVMQGYDLLTPGYEVDSGQGCEAGFDGGRPTVVDRDHRSWAEVDAEQRERLGDPPGEDGRT